MASRPPSPSRERDPSTASSSERMDCGFWATATKSKPWGGLDQICCCGWAAQYSRGARRACAVCAGDNRTDQHGCAVEGKRPEMRPCRSRVPKLSRPARRLSECVPVEKRGQTGRQRVEAAATGEETKVEMQPPGAERGWRNGGPVCSSLLLGMVGVGPL